MNYKFFQNLTHHTQYLTPGCTLVQTLAHIDHQNPKIVATLVVRPPIAKWRPILAFI